VERLFRNSHSGPNEFGIYGVNICKNGQWTDIVIDDWIPVKNGKPVFSRAKGSELWVLLLEKAWAKLHGSYHSIESGLAITALRDLTGAPCFIYKIEKEDKQKLWEMMC
jgi:calpain-15